MTIFSGLNHFLRKFSFSPLIGSDSTFSAVVVTVCVCLFVCGGLFHLQHLSGLTCFGFFSVIRLLRNWSPCGGSHEDSDICQNCYLQIVLHHVCTPSVVKEWLTERLHLLMKLQLCGKTVPLTGRILSSLQDFAWN